MSFSGLKREVYKEALSRDTYDVLIIGGGITGAGIALDAAARGLKTALVERNDFASGTSSRSTKLIHGGLRYLKQFEVKLVHEVGVERATVYRNAPHIVIPEKMLLPIVKGGSLGKYSSSIGLFVYDRLAKVRLKERRRMLSRAKTLQKEPLLRRDIVLGGGLYIEYRSDDARLVIEVMKTAVAKGAVCLNYASLKEFTHDDKGRISGGVVEDKISGDRIQIRAKTVINACGPWVDDLRIKEGSLNGKRLLLTKGVHLVVSHERLPLHSSVYFDVPTDNRMIFAIPRGKVVYIGTTDTVYKDDANHPFTTKEDAAYILEAANYMFPDAGLTFDDVESSWAGLRPLIYEDGKDPSEVSRKDEIFLAETGLISIAGGKLTGYRKMAERSVDVAMEHLKEIDGRPFKKCTTSSIVLSGGHFGGQADIARYIDYLAAQNPETAKDIIYDLVYRYGDRTEEIFEICEQDPEAGLLMAEVEFCIRNEAVASVSDFLIRRTGKLFFERPELENSYLDIHRYITNRLGHDADVSAALLREFEKEYQGVVAFKEEAVKLAV